MSAAALAFHQTLKWRVMPMFSTVGHAVSRVSSHRRQQTMPGRVRLTAWVAYRLTGTGSTMRSSAACVVAKLWYIEVSRRLFRSNTDTTRPTWVRPARAVAWMYWAYDGGMPASTSKLRRSRSTPWETTDVPTSARMRSGRGVVVVLSWMAATAAASSPRDVSPIRYWAYTRSDPASMSFSERRLMSSKTATPWALEFTYVSASS